MVHPSTRQRDRRGKGFFRLIRDELIEAIETHVRYDTRLFLHKSVDGEAVLTRRENNARFGKPSPEVDVPEVGEYLWDWFFDVDARIARIQDGECRPIPPSEWLAWVTVTGNIVRRWELGILTALDLAYCKALNIELEEKRQREASPNRKK